ncbi:MAG: exodeoxyribonuclease VII small subunit [Deltaproteobacteria bacterium]|nr:exodeoxyribonuclease VII small subunit [Deltaproteobacteria bacterium]
MAEKTFEDSMKRLEEIVQQLEGGEMPLEDSLRVFEEGMKLAAFCSRKLEEAEKKVTLLVCEQGGGLVEKPFGPDEAEDDTP